MSTSGNRSQSMNVTGGEEIVGRINRENAELDLGSDGGCAFKVIRI